MLAFTATSPLPAAIDGAAVVAGPRAYGGTSSPGTARTELLSYSSVNNTWGVERIGPARAFAAGAGDSTHFFYGGLDAGGARTATLLRENAGFTDVTPVGGALPAVQGATLSAVNGSTEFVSFGGELSPGSTTDAMFRIGCTPSPCIAIAVASAVGPAPRAFHAARYARETNRLYVFGGAVGNNGDARELWSWGPACDSTLGCF